MVEEKKRTSGEIIETKSVKKLIEKFKDKVLPYPNPAKEATVVVDKSIIIDVLKFLKEDEELKFDYLSDLTAVHYPGSEKPIVVVYHLFSIENRDSLRVKVELNDKETIPSAVSVWKAANWMEREAYDLMGVVFEGHPDLRRILLPDDWEGHPLRKEYPLGGPQEEMIRANKYGIPALLPDNLEEAKKIIEEQRNAE